MISEKSIVTTRAISDKFRKVYKHDLEALGAAIDKGLSGTSTVVDEYEKSLGAWFGNDYAVAVSSGTAALSVSMGALNISLGDEVVLTPTSPLCTVYPIMAAGATPVFVDTNEDGFGINLKSLEKVINAKTRAIIDIPMWGYPTEVDQLQKLALENNLPLILDLAHSHGTTLHGKPLSHYGDLSCFSTHERKPLATGEGGFILTNSEELASACRNYSRFGNLGGKEFGLNYKLAALPAAVGSNRLGFLGDQISKRQDNARRFLSLLNNSFVSEHKIIEGGVANYYALLLKLNFNDNKKFIDYMDNNGVPSDIKRYGCCCLYEFPIVARYKTACPNGELLLNTVTTIPMHPGIKNEDIDYMVSLINDYKET